MGVVKKKNRIVKAWEHWRSLGAGIGNKRYSLLKATSNEKGHQIAPHGCFSVYVGPHRQKFVVKTEFVNHPLFKMLLDEAEQEYGFKSDGPIWLPCNVDLFYKVLAEMDGEEDIIPPTTCSFTKSKGFLLFVPPSPARLLCYINKGHNAHSVMDSEMLKIDL